MDAQTPEDVLGRHGTSERFHSSGAHSAADEQAGGPDLPLLRLVDPRTLQLAPIPERSWVVRDWLPVGHVTLNFGGGGTGKTLIAQQLMTACATGTPWCGLAVQRCKSIGFFAEDDGDELHRRQDAIGAATGIAFDDLGDMRWASGVGEDNVLAAFDHTGRMVITDRYRAIEAATVAFGARLVVIDTAADCFAGNENDRAQVRQFMNLLNRLAQRIRGAVLLNAHPSRSGMAVNGDMDGGSTAWSNSARSRWALGRPKAEDDAEQDADERVLTRRKANYSTIGDSIKLRWRKGVLVLPDHSGGMFTAAVDRAQCETVFLDLLAKFDASNFPLSGQKNASNYAPRQFAQRPDRQGYGRAEFEQALTRLMTDGRITLKSYGRPGDERRRLALATVSEATQAEASEEKSDD